MGLDLSYPHFRPSYEPRHLSAEDIAAVAEQARAQLCPHPRRPAVDPALIIKRCTRIVANGIALQIHIELGEGSNDQTGHRDLGVTEHDARWPDRVRIHLNTSVIGAQEDLIRSTLVHELGHAIFDGPSWAQQATQAPTGVARVETRFLQAEQVRADRRHRVGRGDQTEVSGHGCYQPAQG